jgi:hypothetical protein
MGWWPDPAFPTPRSDKYAWRKVFDRNPLFTEVSDKLTAKTYALTHCPEVRVAKTLWTGSRPEDIPDDLLSGNVVVKANHGSSWNYFVRDGNCNREELNRLANGWLSRRFRWRHAERGYYGVEPVLFVEEMLLEKEEPIHNEYKFYIGSGQMAYVFLRQLTPERTRIHGVLNDAGERVAGTNIDGTMSDEVPPPRRISQASRSST